MYNQKKMSLFLALVIIVVVMLCVLVMFRTYGTLKSFKNNQDIISRNTHANDSALESKMLNLTKNNNDRIDENKHENTSRINSAAEHIFQIQKELPPLQTEINNVRDEISPLELDILEIQKNMISKKNFKEHQQKFNKNEHDNKSKYRSDSYIRDVINKEIDERREEIGTTKIIREETESDQDLSLSPRSRPLITPEDTGRLNIGKFQLYEQDSGLFIKNTNEPDSQFLLFAS
jgi:predicted RND superfamily exporter protein